MMRFNDHKDLAEQHAFLSPSGYHWVNYDRPKLIDRYSNYRASLKGTELHEFASAAINNKIQLANRKKALNAFVNDAIGFRMDSERVLYYSQNCFGTADAISFRDNLLRIFDLKTGKTRCSFTQLDVYAAIFCLEYGYLPQEIEIEERIYQGNGFTTRIPPYEEIQTIMDVIVSHDQILEEVRSQESF